MVVVKARLAGFKYLMFVLTLASCAPPTAEQLGTSETDSSPAVSAAAAAAPTTEPEAAAPPKPVSRKPVPAPSPTSLPFMPWAVENCTIDALAPTPYSRAWLRYPKPADWVRPSDPTPLYDSRVPPKPGSIAAKETAAALEKAWLQRPESHVLDCSFRLYPRKCPHCVKQDNTLVRYIVYLPAKTFTEPSRVKSVLLIVPGGHGGRSRAFLRPINGLTVWDKGSGGLDAKSLADAFYAASPDGDQSLVVSLETSGIQHGSGAVEYLTYDIEQHLRTTFLPQNEPLRIGVDGVSSGAREIIRAAFAKPESFRTIGLHCMACGGIHPERRLLGTRTELLAFAKTLAQSRAQGRFDLRMSIGSRDNQLPCNQAYWALFREAGLVTDSDSDLFRIVPGALHDFLFLAQAFPTHLQWHLEKLRQTTRD